jgi:hypothetical protein
MNQAQQRAQDAKTASEMSSDFDRNIPPSAETTSTATRPMEVKQLGSAGGERAGKDFTQAGKKIVKDDNRAANGGKMKCENCGKRVRDAKQSKKGKSPRTDEANVDHIVPKAEGGDGSPPNGQVLCFTCNNQKSDKI